MRKLWHRHQYAVRRNIVRTLTMSVAVVALVMSGYNTELSTSQPVTQCISRSCQPTSCVWQLLNWQFTRYSYREEYLPVFGLLTIIATSIMPATNTTIRMMMASLLQSVNSVHRPCCRLVECVLFSMESNLRAEAESVRVRGISSWSPSTIPDYVYFESWLFDFAI